MSEPRWKTAEERLREQLASESAARNRAEDRSRQLEADLVAMQAERDRFKAALSELSDSERNYRMIHDLDGDAHINAGRAWDKMRQAGHRARALLTPPQGGQKA